MLKSVVWIELKILILVTPDTSVSLMTNKILLVIVGRHGLKRIKIVFL